MIKHLTLTSLIAALILTSIVVPAVMSQSVSVTTNKYCYDRGETVVMSINGTGVVGVEVVGPASNIVWVGQLNLSSSKVVSFIIPKEAPEGNYSVYVAANGSVPYVATKFIVRNPTFKIVRYTRGVSGYENSYVSVKAVIANYGADGSAEVLIADQLGKVVTAKYVYLRYNTSATVTLNLHLPWVATNTKFRWTLAVIDVKYGTVDDSATIEVSVSKRAVTVAPPPATTATAPPTVTTVTTTIPRPTITTVVPPPIITTTIPVRAKVVSLAEVMAPNGTVMKKVEAKLPVGGSLIIPAGTKVTLKGKPVKSLIIKPVTKAPPAPKTQVVAGPMYLIGPNGTVFSKPVTIVLPFNPLKIPVGYRPLAAYYNETLKRWVPIETVKVDYRTLTVTAKLRHLSIISVIAFRVIYPVKTTPTSTITVAKYVTATITSVKYVTTQLTKTSVFTRTLTYLTTVPSTAIVTMTKTQVPTTYVTQATTLHVTNYLTTTSTVTVTATKYVPQTSYIYAAVVAVIVAVVILVVMSTLGPRRGGGR